MEKITHEALIKTGLKKAATNYFYLLNCEIEVFGTSVYLSSVALPHIIYMEQLKQLYKLLTNKDLC